VNLGDFVQNEVHALLAEHFRGVEGDVRHFSSAERHPDERRDVDEILGAGDHGDVDLTLEGALDFESGGESAEITTDDDDFDHDGPPSALWRIG
jgi:hypothetical protein